MSLPPSTLRLPSPPPPTEIQIGPKSPSLGDSSSGQETAIEQVMLDANAARRIHPGTKSADMAAGPPLVPLMELDSAFQLQEHLKALHHHHTKPHNTNHTIPISRSTASHIANPPNGVDRALWLYELCRFLINKCNDIIVGFLFDSPPCSSVTCPEMRASEWQFLCAVHESPKSCCAIDYCCHTLDWATNIVTSQKNFPSRLSLGAGEGMDDRGAGVKHLVNIFRRLHRIFAHAWFQHREVFWRVEIQTGLYVLFKTVCDNYELLPAENYKLPPEAEGLEVVPDSKLAHTILKPDLLSASNAENKLEDEDPNLIGGSRTNTRRHIRSSPSTGSAVTTVLEADEDDSDVTQRLVDMHITDDEAELGVEYVDATTEKAKVEISIGPEADSRSKDLLNAVPEVELEAEPEPEADLKARITKGNASTDYSADPEELDKKNEDTALNRGEEVQEEKHKEQEEKEKEEEEEEEKGKKKDAEEVIAKEEAAVEIAPVIGEDSKASKEADIGEPEQLHPA